MTQCAILTHTVRAGALADEGATSIVEMLFCTSLVALVGAGDKPGSSTRKLQIVNTKVSLSRQALAIPGLCYDQRR